MSNETNNPFRPANRPNPQGPGQPANSPPPAPWEIGRTPAAEPPKNIYSERASQSQSLAPPPQPAPYVAPGAYRQSVADDFQATEPSDIGRKIGIFFLALLCLCLGFGISWALMPSHVLPPTGYTPYVSPDQRFSIDAPDGWSVTSSPVQPGSDATIGTAFFRSGAGKIQVTSDSVGALKGNVLLSSGAALPEDFTANPAKAEHDFQESKVAATMKNYVEQSPFVARTKFGPAYVSEFTGVGGLFGLGGPMHGYRASATDGNNVFEIVVQCPQKSWSAMAPPFMRVVRSIGPASGGSAAPATGSGEPNGGLGGAGAAVGIGFGSGGDDVGP